jgi:hypothetical protein
MYIAAKILLTYLASLTAPESLAAPDPLTAPDLCDVVYPDTGTPKICTPHEDGAPVYDAEVCCTSSTCRPATANRSAFTASSG